MPGVITRREHLPQTSTTLWGRFYEGGADFTSLPKIKACLLSFEQAGAFSFSCSLQQYRRTRNG